MRTNHRVVKFATSAPGISGARHQGPRDDTAAPTRVARSPAARRASGPPAMSGPKRERDPICDVCGHCHVQGVKCTICGHVGKYIGAARRAHLHTHARAHAYAHTHTHTRLCARAHTSASAHTPQCTHMHAESAVPRSTRWSEPAQPRSDPSRAAGAGAQPEPDAADHRRHHRRRVPTGEQPHTPAAALAALPHTCCRSGRDGA